MAFIKGFIMSFILVTIGRKLNDKEERRRYSCKH